MAKAGAAQRRSLLRLGLLLELPPRGATSLTKLVAVEQQRHEHDLATFRARARVALRQG